MRYRTVPETRVYLPKTFCQYWVTHLYRVYHALIVRPWTMALTLPAEIIKKI